VLGNDGGKLDVHGMFLTLGTAGIGRESKVHGYGCRRVKGQDGA
jgi:hypothetical protein